MEKSPATNTIVRHPLLTAILESPSFTSRVEIKRITFAPDQKTPVHLHPCPVVGYIAAGSVRLQIEGQAEKTLDAGDAFFEPSSVTILHFDNASATLPMTFIAFYLLENSSQELIHLLE